MGLAPSERRWLLATGGADAAASGGLVLFPLDLGDAERGELAALLSAEEQRRSARFRFAHLTERYIVAHGRLRQLLAEQLQMPPRDLQFAAGPHGKPRLAGAAAASGLQFNLSHSGNWGLVGWSRGRAIGVDIELRREMRDEAALVHRYFSPVEIAAYEALPAERRQEGFFNAWTRKEAYVKAVGRGLALSLSSFDVSLDNGPGARLLRPSAEGVAGGNDLPHSADNSWSLAAPDDVDGAAIAVVVQSSVLKLTPAIPISS